MTRIYLLIALLAFTLGGCRMNSPTLNPVETEAPAATATTNSPSPTDTPELPSPTATTASTSTPEPTPGPLYPPEGMGPDNFPPDVSPLTGLVVENPENLQRRPLAVKVNIIPRATNRPPWGISFADIIYEYYQNNGMTRFHTIFLSQDAPLVGPIRSARMPDGPLVRMYQSIFAYSGADGNVDITLRNSNFGYRLARDRGPRTECPPTVAVPLCRFDPDGNDFLLAGTREVHENMVGRGVDDEAQNLDGMFFKMESPEDGKPAKDVWVRFSLGSYNRWEYETETGRYLRFQENVSLTDVAEEEFAPLVDRLTDEQIAFDNVVVLFVPHEYFRQPPGEIISINFEGEGKGYAFRDGLMYEVKWVHPIMDSIMKLQFENGETYAFKPGTTWFHILGQFSTIEQAETVTWKFRFGFP
jgi:hypothetical protein